MSSHINKRPGRITNSDEVWINKSDLTAAVEEGKTYPILCWERQRDVRQSVIQCRFLRWEFNVQRTDPQGQAVFGMEITHG